MSGQQVLKKCLQCHEDKPLSDYYVSIKKYGTLHPRCRPCHNENRLKYNVKKKCGFGKLSEDVQRDIIKLIEAKTKLVVIVEKYNIPYSTLSYWKRNDKIHLAN